MDKEQWRSMFRWLVALTMGAALFAGLNFALAKIVPAPPEVQAMLFGGAAIILTYIAMMEKLARYSLALLLTCAAYLGSHWLLAIYVLHGAEMSSTMSWAVAVGHVLLLLGLISFLDDSALFGEACPQCEARGAVSEEVVDRYRQSGGYNGGVLERRTRVTNKLHCRKCGHSWFERHFVYEH